MGSSLNTVWGEIERAKQGDEHARSLFALRYAPVVQTYLQARWGGTVHAGDVDDAVQEVFVDFLRGALERADPSRPFRPFLFGVARNVALRFEQQQRRKPHLRLDSDYAEVVPGDDDPASVVFDRAWANALMSEARRLQADVARDAGAAALRRVELLALRFGEGLPVREIAERFGEDPTRTHRQYAQARLEFQRALREVVARHHPGSQGQVDAECRRLIGCFRG